MIRQETVEIIRAGSTFRGHLDEEGIGCPLSRPKFTRLSTER